MFSDLSRSVIRVSGGDAARFLQGLLTQDVIGLEIGGVRYGAFLTPQGKIITDLMIWRDEGGFLLDVFGDVSNSILMRLNVYKLSADVALEHTAYHVIRSVDGELSADVMFRACDPRSPLLGWVGLVERAPVLSSADFAEDWNKVCVETCVASMGVDFATEQMFPHDLNLDVIGGISLTKGCYVGQEVVSRMVHKGGVKRRLMMFSSLSGDLLDCGDVVTDTGVVVGVVSRAYGGSGIGVARVDRAEDAGKLFCDAIEVQAALPTYLSKSLDLGGVRDV